MNLSGNIIFRNSGTPYYLDITFFFLVYFGNFSAFTLHVFSVHFYVELSLIKIYLSKLFLMVYIYQFNISVLYMYSHVIHNFGNNMGI